MHFLRQCSKPEKKNNFKNEQIVTKTNRLIEIKYETESNREIKCCGVPVTCGAVQIQCDQLILTNTVTHRGIAVMDEACYLAAIKTNAVLDVAWTVR